MSERGRLPPYEPSEKDREMVAILAGNGIPHAIIAKCITSPDTDQAISLSTLKRHFKPELKTGRAQSDAGLIRTAYEMSKTNAAVLIFMLKTRLGWKEPATEINLRQTYEELVREAAKVKPGEKPDLKLVPTTSTEPKAVDGGKAA